MTMIVSTDQEVADESYGAAWGAAVVSDQAVAIGVTAVPTPVTDASSDLWFAYQAMVGRYQFRDATGAGRDGFVYELDSKAMRKVNQGEDIITVAESSVGDFGGGSFVSVFGRMLVKTH